MLVHRLSTNYDAIQKAISITAFTQNFYFAFYRLATRQWIAVNNSYVSNVNNNILDH